MRVHLGSDELGKGFGSVGMGCTYNNSVNNKSVVLCISNTETL